MLWAAVNGGGVRPGVISSRKACSRVLRMVWTPVDGRARGDDAGDEVADVVVGQHGGAHHVIAHLVDHSEGGQEGGDSRGCGDHHLKNAVAVQPGQRALVAQAPGAEDANSVGHLLDL